MNSRKNEENGIILIEEMTNISKKDDNKLG